MPFPYEFPFCFEDVICPDIWIPTLGSLELERVLDWQEHKRVKMPSKKILKKLAPTNEPTAYTDMVREIVIVCRLTDAERTTFYAMEGEGILQQLFYRIGYAPRIVWIENGDTDYVIKEHVEAPWLVTIRLLERIVV